MKPGVVLLRVTGAVLGLQLLLGGLLTFGFISPDIHIVGGFTLLILAIATMVVWLRTKPSFRPLQRITTSIVALILLQIALGFLTLNTGSNLVALIHFLVALGIFGATLAGTFIAMRWSYAGEGHAAEDASGHP